MFGFNSKSLWKLAKTMKAEGHTVSLICEPREMRGWRALSGNVSCMNDKDVLYRCIDVHAVTLLLK